MEVLLAGAALTLGLLALSALATWGLAARVRPDPKAVFFAIFEDRIRRSFPSQSSRAMSTVLTGINSVLRPSPESPCVLLLVSEPRADATALRLARALAAAVQVGLGRPRPPVIEYSSPRPGIEPAVCGAPRACSAAGRPPRPRPWS